MMPISQPGWCLELLSMSLGCGIEPQTFFSFEPTDNLSFSVGRRAKTYGQALGILALLNT